VDHQKDYENSYISLVRTGVKIIMQNSFYSHTHKWNLDMCVEHQNSNFTQ